MRCYKQSVMYGNNHDLQRYTDTGLGGTMSAWSLGCLKDIDKDASDVEEKYFRGESICVQSLKYYLLHKLRITGYTPIDKILSINTYAFDWIPTDKLPKEAQDIPFEIDVSNDSLREAAISLTGGRGADIVIIGPNSISAIDAGLQCTAPGGTAVLFTPAGPGEHLTIDPNYLYFRDINIVTSYSCGPDDTKKSLELILEGAVTAQKLVTHRFSIDETERAYRLVADAKESLKVLITFD